VEDRLLPFPPGFKKKGQRLVALFESQLTDQYQRIKARTEGLETTHLEWQPGPGVNTIGMILAHIAVADVCWFSVSAPPPRPAKPHRRDYNAACKRVLGMKPAEDGFPLAANAKHPKSLEGWELGGYFDLLDKAQASRRLVLQSWRDADLDLTFQLRGRAISYGWTVYHVLEHTAGHFGQILLLKHLMATRGFLPE
jgi:uncharacterized damage-inducible protein DinB